MSLKRTPLYDVHIEMGAKMVEFAGWCMPLQYTSIIREHRAVRENVGLFDVSHMGEFVLRGRDAAANLERLATNLVSNIPLGRTRYTLLCNETGGIIDDLLIYRLGDAEFMLAVNAANISRDFRWISSHLEGEANLEDVSDRTGMIAVQGPFSREVLQKLTDVELSSLSYYSFVRARVAGCDVTISRTGYTGELGYEIYCRSPDAISIWRALLEAGEGFGISPCGLGARDTLRLEMGYCLHGNDIDETTTPIEADLGWAVKEKDFIGSEVVLRQKAQGVGRKLVGFIMIEKGMAARRGDQIRLGGRIVGRVTSGSISPSLGKPVGLAYVESGLSRPGTVLGVVVRGKTHPVEVVELPFYKNGTARK
ncbi:MAG: glycine cleavage system aminomethyltransferase GcvT [bacterium]